MQCTDEGITFKIQKVTVWFQYDCSTQAFNQIGSRKCTDSTLHSKY